MSSHLKIETFKDLESAEIPPSDLELLKEMIQPPGMKIWKASLSDHSYAIHLDTFSLCADMLVGNDTFGFLYNDTFLTEDDFISEDGYLKQSDTFWHEAWEVLFHLCVQSYDTKVQAGADETQMVSSIAIPMEPEDSAFMDINCPQSLSAKPREDSPRPGSKSEAFSANYLSIELAALRLRESLTSWVVTKYEDSDLSKPITLSMRSSDFIGSLWSAVLFHPRKLLDHTARNDSLHNIYLNVATALSSVIRRAELNYTEHAFNITGQAWEAETYVQVRWGWLSFLAFELVLAATVLALTIAAQKSNQNSESGRESIQEQSSTFGNINTQCRKTPQELTLTPLARRDDTDDLTLKIAFSRRSAWIRQGSVSARHGDLDPSWNPSITVLWNRGHLPSVQKILLFHHLRLLVDQ
ncbi:hypothetical protein MRS44_005743 [Fusarium solani]|uniref:uncharacterized protein n=1 Tax=Fusarium solani TaxID=169388 RepID=UPI0032C40C2E|nr:hypothetical protein MRS44_005743 [Fusarium solani]